jgi:hypothetical protein
MEEQVEDHAPYEARELPSFWFLFQTERPFLGPKIEDLSFIFRPNGPKTNIPCSFLSVKGAFPREWKRTAKTATAAGSSAKDEARKNEGRWACKVARP